MSLRARLDRLEAAVGARTSRVEATAAPPPPAKPRLDDLREQLRAVLARDAARPVVARKPRGGTALESLPFVRVDSPSGAFWRRSERLEASHRVGTVALERAASAAPEVLSELALDAAVANAAPSGWLFLDTETTGLGGAGSIAFLIGLAWLEAGAVRVEQLLLADPADERALLEHVHERVRSANLIVSFNGRAFDRPLIDTRLIMQRLPPLPKRPELDLLHIGRRLHRARLQSCSLKRLEAHVLGFDRGHDIDGAEVGALYAHFLRTGDASGVAKVVAHNFWDVVSMVALTALYGERTPALDARDLVGLAQTLRRAGAAEHAERAAERACALGAGIEALRVRAALAKARGDVEAAVRHLERLCREADDARGRLELAKLYEHALLAPALALEWVELGTGETAADHARRRCRLERKIRRTSPS